MDRSPAALLRLPSAPRRHLLLLSLAVLVLYGSTLRFGFVWDDLSFAVRNRALSGGIAVVPNAFLRGDALGDGGWNPYYRPLTTLSFAAAAALSGENPAGHHAANLFLHLGAVLALYSIGRKVLATDGAAFAAALLFAVHPAVTEPVAWVSARGDLLCALFSALALASFARRLVTGSTGEALLSTLLLAAALLSKELPVVLPAFALLLALREPSPEGRKRALLPLLLWCGAVAAFLAARSAVLAEGSWGDTPAGERFALAGPALLSYVRYALLPAGLKVFHPSVPAPPPLSFPVLASWAILAAAWGALAAAFRRHPLPAAGAAWFFLLLLPVSGLLGALYPTPLADRYLYMPLMGLSVALVDVASRLPALHPALRSRRAGAVALAAVALPLAAVTAVRLPVWRDSRALWTEAARVAPRSDYVLCNLGVTLLEEGKFAEAEEVLERAVRGGSGDPNVFANLAIVLGQRGDFAGAERAVRESLRQYPTSPEYLKTLVWVLDARGRRAEGREAVREAARLDPGNGSVRRLLEALEKVGDYPEPIPLPWLQSL